jgi:hypothetical protein
LVAVVVAVVVRGKPHPVAARVGLVEQRHSTLVAPVHLPLLEVTVETTSKLRVLLPPWAYLLATVAAVVE